MSWEIIGILAASLTTFSFLPQVIKMFRTKSVGDISIFMLVELSMGVSLWALYGIHLRDGIIIAANAITLLILISALTLYIKYK